MRRIRGTILRVSGMGMALMVALSAVLWVQPASAAYGTYFTVTAVSAKGRPLYSLRATSFTQPTMQTSQVISAGDKIPARLRTSSTVKELIVSVKETTANYSRLTALETRLPAGIKLSAVVVKQMSSTTKMCVDKWRASPAWAVNYSFPDLNAGSAHVAKFTYAYELMTRLSC